MVTSQLRCDLLGWPSRGLQLAPHVVPQPRPLFEPPRFRTSCSMISAVMSPSRSIRQPASTSADLPSDRSAMTTQPSSDLRIALTNDDPDPDLVSVLERQRARSLLSVPDHDHMFGRDQRTDRPLRDPRPRRSLPPPRSPPHRRQCHPNLSPRNPRTSHPDTPNQKMSR